ncbi:hypothetical protein DFR67_12544 [Williamsia limnetica]|uniref:Small secreted hydrophilic protein n=1 Tax=Williamsia limnetica TaxID=882452 RepID=A0A318RSW4_WILLI|nr:hypothetical protein [Williamsia limnetica]PYE12123.1 hypothetical protein DFR67_12544 [Williamsia limnetica]
MNTKTKIGMAAAAVAGSALVFTASYGFADSSQGPDVPSRIQIGEVATTAPAEPPTTIAPPPPQPGNPVPPAPGVTDDDDWDDHVGDNHDDDWNDQDDGVDDNDWDDDLDDNGPDDTDLDD